MKKIILMCLFGLMVGQTEWTTRIYTINYSFDSFQTHHLQLDDITGIDLEYARISIIDILQTGSINLEYGCVSDSNFTNFVSLSGASLTSTNGSHLYHSDKTCQIRNSSNWSLNTDLVIAITAEFPEEDTGYIEEGFDFCLVEGNNLVAFPCDNPVSVETAIPELARAEITQIIGAGVAATNFNGQFVGSLSNFTPASGYWFKSNSNMCFNYTCAE